MNINILKNEIQSIKQKDYLERDLCDERDILISLFARIEKRNLLGIISKSDFLEFMNLISDRIEKLKEKEYTSIKEKENLNRVLLREGNLNELLLRIIANNDKGEEVEKSLDRLEKKLNQLNRENLLGIISFQVYENQYSEIEKLFLEIINKLESKRKYDE